jgi:hypothetical protein
MGSMKRRLEALEGRMELPESPRRPDVRARMKAVLDELAAAKREGRAPSDEALAVSEAIEWRRGREPA